MIYLVVKRILVIALIMAISANAQPVQQDQPQQIAPSLKGRSMIDEYVLGLSVDGARIIYSGQNVTTAAGLQSQISSDFVYPLENDTNAYVITQLTLYVEAADGATTQAYVLQGGIGETSVTLQSVAYNSDFVRYWVVLYGKLE